MSFARPPQHLENSSEIMRLFLRGFVWVLSPLDAFGSPFQILFCNHEG